VEHLNNSLLRTILNSASKKIRIIFKLPPLTPLSPEGEALSHSGLKFSPLGGVRGVREGKVEISGLPWKKNLRVKNLN
jgi:hypothetical protein